MKEIERVANALWMMRKWMSENEVPKRVKVKKAMLEMEAFLSLNRVEIIDLTGKVYDSGMNCQIMNEEFEEEKENQIIVEMIQPMVYQDGKIVQYGKALVEEQNDEEEV